MLNTGDIIGGRYRIIRHIGKGGMSNVYLAINERANKLWAVKEVRKDGGKNKEVVRQSLVRETAILRRLKHRNLPSIIDVLETEDTYQIVMDYIEGVTLLKKLNAEGAQSQEDVVRWSIALCDVLGYLHSKGIIYRDTKPANIMIKPDGDVVLIDFGTAREYRQSKEGDTTWLGTRGYAAPEQFGGSGQTDARTDIYNLGATMYHLLTDHNPSLYPYEMYPIRKWNASLSSGLEAIILKCTKSNPEDRYGSCAELAYDLNHFREMEEGYLKKLKKYWAVFLGLVGAAALSFAASGVLSYEAAKITRSTYASYMRQAQIAVTNEDKRSLYRSAIDAAPVNASAYDELLKNVYLEDGVFDESEANELGDILNETSSRSSKTHLEYLQSSPAAYEEFSYDLGIAYFYYYGGNGNKPLSQPWFAVAKESHSLDPIKQKRAERFYAIAGYYNSLSSRDKAGDTKASYSDYWHDLTQLSSGNLVGSDNAATALVMYKELIYQATMHAADFKRSGITQEEMSVVIENITEHLMDDFDLTSMDLEDADTVLTLRTLVREALASIDTAFNTEDAKEIADDQVNIDDPEELLDLSEEQTERIGKGEIE